MLNKHGINPIVVDPVADKGEVASECGIIISDLDDVRDADCIVLAVAHSAFRSMSAHSPESLYKKMPNKEKVLIDIKGLWPREELETIGYNY